MDIVVAFIFFNKEDTTKKVFQKIKEAKPNRIYLISDGARNEKEKQVVCSIREWIENNIDWNCNVTKIYATKNMGCRNRVVTGINEVFEHEEAAVILEDDCLPLNGFFEYCKTMLEYYKDASQIMMVNGSNLVPRKNYEIKEDYTFSANSWVWGWATWKRAWKLYDPEIKNWPYVKKNKVLNGIYNSKYRFKKEISKGLDLVYKHKLDTWDYQWQFAIWINYGLCIVPRYNYVENLGFDIKEATHTCDEMPAYLKKVYAQKNETINMQLDGHYIVRNVKLDAAFDRMLFLENYSLKSILRKVKNLLGLK